MLIDVEDILKLTEEFKGYFSEIDELFMDYYRVSSTNIDSLQLGVESTALRSNFISHLILHAQDFVVMEGFENSYRKFNYRRFLELYFTGLRSIFFPIEDDQPIGIFYLKKDVSDLINTLIKDIE